MTNSPKPEAMTAERLAGERLKTFIRDEAFGAFGQCHILSEGGDCDCLLCCVDNLVAEITRLKSDNDGLLGEIDELKSEILRLDERIASLKQLLRDCPAESIRYGRDDCDEIARQNMVAWLDAREKAIGET